MKLIGVLDIVGSKIIEGLVRPDGEVVARERRLGLANDSVGYISPRACFEEGGFEIEASPFEPGVGVTFRDALIAQARAMI
ncbi:MAG: hypothetical protein QN178_00770 [Armatimonadota bacterium]|nr:hypothetical protein [Armatimonadota bacterium]